VYEYAIFLCKKSKFLRTNIDIDDKLLARAMSMSGAKTKKEAVNQALKD
jgi:Arc/MetJ family transcription regulator